MISSQTPQQNKTALLAKKWKGNLHKTTKRNLTDAFWQKSNGSILCMSADSNRGLPFKPTQAMAVCYSQNHFLHPCGQPLIHNLMACCLMESHQMGAVHRTTHHTRAICDDCYLIHVLLRETRLVQLITSTVFHGEETKYSFSADNTELRCNTH